MRCELIKIKELSGSEASVYTVLLTGEQKTRFDLFIEENSALYLSEIKNILLRLKTIGTNVGARESYFKKNEGTPGDGVCALYDDPSKKLRLYCIRYGSNLVILGGGGPKPKQIRTWQQDPKLKAEAEFLIQLSSQITKRLIEKDIYYINNRQDFEGDLFFEINI